MRALKVTSQRQIFELLETSLELHVKHARGSVERTACVQVPSKP